MSLNHLTTAATPNPNLNPRFNSLFIDNGVSVGTLSVAGPIGTVSQVGTSQIFFPPANSVGSLGGTPTAPLDCYDAQSLTNQTMTGALASSTMAINLIRIGRMCFVQVSSASGTAASGTTCVLPALPSGYAPSQNQFTFINGQNNGANSPLNAQIATSGVITIGVSSGASGTPGNFTTSAACGWPLFMMSYHI